MIYTRLAGGLGNQLFQYAATLALRGESKGSVLLSTDGLRRYQVKRNFDLMQLLHLPDGFHTDMPGDIPGQLASALLRWRIGRLLPNHGVNDRNFAEHLALLRSGMVRQPLWLDGYFQHGWQTQMFEIVRARMSAALRNDLPTSRVSDAAAVVHIRGGDFLASEVHCVVDTGYYVEALAMLRARLPSLVSVTVVTDDIAYAAPIIDCMARAQPDLALSLAPPPNAAAGAAWLQDFVLLRDARARIIGNSSFAWWAAALDAERALTVAPNKWTRGVLRDLFLPWEFVIAT